MPPSQVPTHPDYAPQIRSEIERDAKALSTALLSEMRGVHFDEEVPETEWPDGDDHLTELRVGYSLNSHRGRQVIPDGTEIAGLPLVTDRVNPRSITVYGSGYDQYAREATYSRSTTW